MNKKIFDVSNEEIKDCVLRLSAEHSVSPELIFAFIKKESAFNVLAMRFEQNWKYLFDIETFAKLNKVSFNTEKSLQSHSWGLMQVMGTVARELGHRGSLLELLIPDVNLKYGILKYKQLLKKYHTEECAISAYNQGNARRLPDGRFANFDYVEDVKKFKLEFSKLNKGE